MKKIFIVLFFLTTNTAIGQKTLTRSIGDSFNKIIARMENHIDLSVKSLGGWEDLMNIPDMLLLNISQDSEFLFVFNHSKAYSNKLLKYIEDPSKKWEYRYFALGLLQGMCFTEYIRFFPKVYDVIRKEIIKQGAANNDIKLWRNYPYADMLYLLAFQNNLSQEMRKNYKNPLLKRYLSEVIGSKFTPNEIKTSYSSILTGQDSESLKQMTPPLFKCRQS